MMFFLKKNNFNAELKKSSALRLLLLALLIKFCDKTGRYYSDLEKFAFQNLFFRKKKMQEITSLIKKAASDDFVEEYYLKKIQHLFMYKKNFYQDVLGFVLSFATFDSSLNERVIYELNELKKGFDLEDEDLLQILSKFVLCYTKNAYRGLGVKRSTPINDVKKRYVKLIQQYHPDKFANVKEPSGLENILNIRMNQLFDYYNTILKQGKKQRLLR